MIDQGADWLKIDSCCGSQDHATAFSDYAKFRDAMNASGKVRVAAMPFFCHDGQP